MSRSQVPSVGRIVHYILPGGPHRGEHRPAIIVKVWSDDPHPQTAVQLQVFTDCANDGPEYASGLHWATSVQQAPEHEHRFGTWHWPEHGPAVESPDPTLTHARA